MGVMNFESGTATPVKPPRPIKRSRRWRPARHRRSVPKCEHLKVCRQIGAPYTPVPANSTGHRSECTRLSAPDRLGRAA